MSKQTEILWGEVGEASTDEWQEVKLFDIIEMIGGGTPKTSVAEYWNGSIPWLSVVDFNTGRKFVFEAEKSITELGLKNCSTNILNQGDIIISARGTVGVVAVLGRPMSFNQSCYGIRSRQGVSFDDYIYYLLKHSVASFIQISHGGVFDTITRDTFKEIDVLLPPLPEQRAIAAVLSSLDDKIDLLHRQNATLEALAETLFRQWFVEEAKEEWEERKVGDIANHLKVGINPVANPTVMYCQYSLPAYDNGQVPTQELGLEILSNKYEVIPNTILISKLNPRFPRIWAIGEKVEANSVCSTEFQVFKPKNQSLYAYFYFLIKSEDVVGEMTMASSGTSGSHQRIRPEDILNIKVRIPSLEKAEEFSSVAQGFIDKVDKNRGVIQTLSTLRDTLLPKLMSGEVRVAY